MSSSLTISAPIATSAARKNAAGYSPAAVIAVSREAMQGVVAEISTSYVERSNLSIRMGCRRFTRLTNGFSKRLDNHLAAIALYVAHYNLCRVHETLRTTPAVQAWHHGSGLVAWRPDRCGAGAGPGRPARNSAAASAPVPGH
jgi:hypothetical protein